MRKVTPDDALDYHRLGGKPGKLAIVPTKPMATQHDLALAYTPGVAVPVLEIARDPALAYDYTAKGNLVAVISNGTAILGLGDRGALAGKPVMEGKAVLFKKFADVDVFDIELDTHDADEIIRCVKLLEPTFGGINLEDIKAPECFHIEETLKREMKIPVFHDDQHGTAIISAAAVLNGLRVVGKKIEDVKLVCSGAGAAAIACVDLMVALGLRRENVWMTDSKGVVSRKRLADLDPSKAQFAQDTAATTLGEVVAGADIFLGLSTAGVLKPEMVRTMADKPLILALANPVPEILPEEAKAVRPDCIIATGRSDYPNQVNNVLCFPFIFRGALDVGATTITQEMELATVRAIADLAHAEQSDVVAAAYAGSDLRFGPEYLIPKPFDPRLIVKIAPAVAKAAMDSGVATRPIAEFDTYREQLQQFVYHSGIIMKPVFAAAKQIDKRIVYAEGEDERVLRAVQVVVDEQLARPILIGRPEVIEHRIQKCGLRIRSGVDFELCNPQLDSRYKDFWQTYLQLTERKGVSPDYAQIEMRRRHTLIGAMMIHKGDADGMLCGTFGTHALHLQYVDQVIGRRKGVSAYYAMNGLMLPKQTVFICDTYVNYDPGAEQLVEMTILAAEELRRFGLTPKVALLSHSSFGSYDTPSARKMQRVAQLLWERAPELEVEGEMHGDAALSEEVRSQVFPHSRLKGEANLLIMPTLDAANIAFNLLKQAAGDGVTIGPILLGTAAPVNILTPTATVRRIVNLTAVTVVEAAARA